MVGPGEVDEELEPEVKEECETKYGEIVSVRYLMPRFLPNLSSFLPKPFYFYWF